MKKLILTKKNAYQTADYLSIAILALAYLMGLYLLIADARLYWIDLVFDDAYYYLSIVRNIVTRGESYFLPPLSTNGYQPLWLILLCVSAKLFGVSNQALVIQQYTLSFILVSLFAIASKRRYGYYFPAIGCALIFFKVTLLGLETTLLPFLCIEFLAAKKWQSRGLLASLIFLSRLDALSLVIAQDIYHLIDSRRNKPNLTSIHPNLISKLSIAKSLNHYLILMPVILLYFAINQKLFGIPIPISGLAKSVGNRVGENLATGLGYLEILLRHAGLLGCAILLLIITNKSGHQLIYKKQLIITTFTLVCCATYYALFSGWPIWDWYFWPILLITYFATLELLHSFNNLSFQNSTNKWPIFVLSITLIYSYLPATKFLGARGLLLFKYLAHIPPTASFGRKNVELVDYLLAQKIANNSFFAMGDRAGSFGFLLSGVKDNQFNFIHTEGLVSDFDYYQAMKADQGLAYIEQYPIDYYIVDREHYLEDNTIIGIAEPIQGLSSHIGPFLLCFNKLDIVYHQSYYSTQRYVLNFKNRVECPAPLKEQFLSLRDTYAGLSNLSLGNEPSALTKATTWYEKLYWQLFS